MEALKLERNWQAKFFGFLPEILWKLNPFVDKLLQELSAAFRMTLLDLILSLGQCKEHQPNTSVQEQHNRAVQHRAKWDCLACCYKICWFGPPLCAGTCNCEKYPGRQEGSDGQGCQVSA